MASKCPHCMSIVPTGLILSRSYGMVCPHCHTRLTVADGGRYLGALAGLLAAALVYRVTRGSGGLLGWALPIVYAFIAFGVVSPLVLMLAADLQTAPPEPEPIALGGAAAPADHGGGHH
jgi:hypothetical protein